MRCVQVLSQNMGQLFASVVRTDPSAVTMKALYQELCELWAVYHGAVQVGPVVDGFSDCAPGK